MESEERFNSTTLYYLLFQETDNNFPSNTTATGCEEFVNTTPTKPHSELRTANYLLLNVLNQTNNGAAVAVIIVYFIN